MSDVPLPVFSPGEKVCGNCKLWFPHSVDARGWVGPCRLQPNRGLFPPSAPICNAFVPKGGAAPVAKPVEERPRPVRSVAPVVRRRDGTQNIELGDLNMTREELIDLFREAAGEPDAPPMASKWEGGTIRIVPGNPELQSKDLPVDALFHKVVMVRDRLRTLEQKINGHPKLTDAEKVEMQHYITRVYGSLTTFNVLFREKGDQFVGAKGEE